VGDILKEFIAYGPNFISDLAKLLSGPKTFLLTLDRRSGGVIARAIVFFVISVAIAFLFKIASQPDHKDIIVGFIALITITAVQIMISCAAVKLSFRIVGGHGAYLDHLIFYLYAVGPAIILGGFAWIVCLGVVKQAFPGREKDLSTYMEGFVDPIEASRLFNQLNKDDLILSVYAITFTFSVVGVVWLLNCWGAFRQLNAIGRMRSTVAFLLFSVLAWPLTWLFTHALKGMNITNF
jgi:hypothetical protein